MKKILKIIFISAFTIVTMFLSTGCFFNLSKNSNTDSNQNKTESSESDNSESSGSDYQEFIESLRSLQNSFYNVFKDIYDDIDGSVYYSDIGYAMDSIEIKTNGKLKISESYPTGSVYYVRWIGYCQFEYSSYKLVYLEVQFNQNFKASKKGMGRYSLQ